MVSLWPAQQDRSYLRKLIASNLFSRASTTTRCFWKTSEYPGQQYQKGPVYVGCI
jgi:hypothetical protein